MPVAAFDIVLLLKYDRMMVIFSRGPNSNCRVRQSLNAQSLLTYLTRNDVAVGQTKLVSIYRVISACAITWQFTTTASRL